MQVRDLDPREDGAWAAGAIDEAFGGRWQARRGELHDVLRLPGLVAVRDGERVGLLLFDPDDGSGEAELAALATPVRGVGAGSALIEALRHRIGGRAIWAVTTNDNVDALRFYQQRGFVIRGLRVGAVSAARRALKPAIPAVGSHGIPIRDEIELVLPADPA